MRRSLRLVPALVVAVLALAGCGQAGDGAAPSTTTEATSSTVTTGPGTSSTTVTTDPGRRFPPDADNLRTGERAFGVYVAVERGSSPAPELARAREELLKVGYSPGPGAPDINCDKGAREALGLTRGVDYYAVAVYFRTRQEAEQFVDAFEPGVVGTAEVTVDCRH